MPDYGLIDVDDLQMGIPDCSGVADPVAQGVIDRLSDIIRELLERLRQLQELEDAGLTPAEAAGAVEILAGFAIQVDKLDPGGTRWRVNWTGQSVFQQILAGLMYLGVHSVVVDGNEIHLLNDEATPGSGDPSYYGYSGAAKGWFALDPADEKVKAHSGDSTAGYLDTCLTAGSNITITVTGETLTIASAAGDKYVKVNVADPAAGYLEGKLAAATGSHLTIAPNGGNTQIEIDWGANLEDLDNVNSGASTNYFLKYNGSNWTPVAGTTSQQLVTDVTWDSGNGRFVIAKCSGTVVERGSVATTYINAADCPP